MLEGGDPGAVPAVAEGRAGVQDEGSQLVALALAAAPLDGPDETWLDLCAGPGGKAALLAALAAERGARLVAHERAAPPRRPRRAGPCGGADGVLGVVAGDGTAAPFRPGTFDRVLVDAPCTGLGALRRRPEARWRRRAEDLPGLVRCSARWSTRALDLVRPGGVVALRHLLAGARRDRGGARGRAGVAPGRRARATPRPCCPACPTAPARSPAPSSSGPTATAPTPCSSPSSAAAPEPTGQLRGTLRALTGQLGTRGTDRAVDLEVLRGCSVDALAPPLCGPGAVVPLPHVQRHHHVPPAVEQVDHDLVVGPVAVEHAERTHSRVDVVQELTPQCRLRRGVRHPFVVAGQSPSWSSQRIRPPASAGRRSEMVIQRMVPPGPLSFAL